MADTDIIIMNTTGKKQPFPVSQNLPDHMAKAVSKTKQISGSMKSTRSTRSLGGLSIFMDPETAESLPRDLEMTMSMYDQEAEEVEGAGTSGNTGHIEVNGDLYATVDRTKVSKKSESKGGHTTVTKTRTVTTTKKGGDVSRKSDDAKSFIFTSELAGEGSGNIAINGLEGSETEGEKSTPVSTSVKETVSVAKGQKGADVGDSNDYTFTAIESGAGGQKASAAGVGGDNKGSSTGGSNRQVNTAVQGVQKAGSFQFKSSTHYGGDPQRTTTTSSSSSLSRQSVTGGQTAQKGEAGHQSVSVTSSVQSVSGQAGGTPGLQKTDSSTVTVTKRDITRENSASSGQKAVTRSGSSSRPTSQGSYQSLSKTAYGVYGKKDGTDSKAAVARSASNSNQSKPATAYTTTTSTTTTHIKSETPRGGAVEIDRKESTKSDASISAANIQQVSRAASKASTRAEQSVSRTSAQTEAASLKSPATATTVTKVTKVTEVERSPSKASDASSIQPQSLVSSQSSLSTIKYSDSQHSGTSGGKYYFKADSGKKQGSSTSLQRSISQASEVKSSEPVSTSTSISSLARQYTKDDGVRPSGSSTNVSTLTDVTVPSLTGSESTLQGPSTPTQARSEISLNGPSTPTPGPSSESPTTASTRTTLTSSSAATTTTTAKEPQANAVKSPSSGPPSASIVQNQAFKAEISALFGAGGPKDSTASAPTSLARSRLKKRQFDTNEDIRLSPKYGELASGLDEDDDAYESQTFPRSATDNDNKIVSSTPTSPIYEIKQTVQAGKVGKLVKDVFWNLPLTGRSLDATLEKKKTAEQKASGELSPTSPSKYKFLVEGIDFPAPEKEEQDVDASVHTSTSQINNADDVPAAAAAADTASDIPDGSTEQGDDQNTSSLKRPLEKKGFSYIIDKKLASEIVKRAETVTRKRPHEKVDQSVQEHRQSKPVPESDLYKSAKAKLHKQESFREALSDEEGEKKPNESDFLKDIRSKLNKQNAARLALQQQQTSHDNDKQTDLHASVSPGPSAVNSTHVLKTEMNAKADVKAKDLAKPSMGSADKSRSQAKETIAVEVAADRSPLSPDSAYQSDPSLSPTMGTETQVQASTSFDKPGAQSHVVTLDSAGPAQKDITVQSAVTVTDNSGLNNRAASNINSSGTRYESQERVLKQTKKTVTTTTTSSNTSGYDDAPGKKQVQETKSDWTSESSTLLKAGDKEHRDSSYASESREFRTLVGGGGDEEIKKQQRLQQQQQPPLRDSSATGAEPQPLSQLDIINATLLAQASREEKASRSVTAPSSSTAQPLAKSPVAEPLRSNEVSSPSVTQKESRGEQRTKDPETKILIQDSANYSSSLQSDSGREASTSNREAKSGRARPLQAEHSFREDAPPQIVVDTVESPRDLPSSFQNNNRPEQYSTYSSDYQQSPAAHRQQQSSRTVEQRGVSPSVTPLNRSFNDINYDRESSFGSLQRNQGTTSTSTAERNQGAIIPLKPLAVNVNDGRHLEMKTHPSTSGLDTSLDTSFSPPPPQQPPPQYQTLSSRYPQGSSSPYGPLSPVSDAGSGSVWLNSPYPTMQTTSKQSSSYIKEYREVNNNETYSYDVGIENIPSPNRKFLKVDELSSGRVPKYASRDIQVHSSTSQQSTSGRPGRAPLDNYPNGLDMLDNDPSVRKGNYQVHKVMQQRMGRETYSQPIDMHPDMQLNNKQKSYNLSQASPGGGGGGGGGPLGGSGTGTGPGPGFSGTVRSTIEIDAVDPSLENASTDGNNYHITLKLNPHGTSSRPGSKTSQYASGENYEDTRYLSSNHTQLQYSPTGPGQPGQPGQPTMRTTVDYQGSNSNLVDNQRKIRVLSSSSAGSRGQTYHDETDGYSSSGAERLYGTGTSGVSGVSGGPPPRYTMAIDQTMTMDYVPKEHEQPQLQSPSYRPAEPGRHKANIYLADSRKVESNTYFEPEPAPLQTSTVYVTSDDDLDNARVNRPRNMNGRPRRSDPDNISPTNRRPNEAGRPRRSDPDDMLSPTYRPNNEAGRPRPDPDDMISPLYRPPNESRRPLGDTDSDPDDLSPTNRRPNESGRPRPYDPDDMLSPSYRPNNEAGRPLPSDDDEDDDGMLQVRRGRIFITNNMDAVGAPQVIDVVDDSDEEMIVDDNTNPFHGKYRQLRENPMYDSDPDNRKDEPDYVYHKKKNRKPAFTEIFQQKDKKTRQPMMNGDDMEVKVTRQRTEQSPRKRRTRTTDRLVKTEYTNGHAAPPNQYDDDDEEMYSEGEFTTKTSTSRTVTSEASRRRGGGGGGGGGRGTYSMERQIASLLQDAPPDSVKQTINVEREEEEIIGPLAESPDDPNGLLNFDTVSEKVDLGLVDGSAQVAVKVRCERIVPIRGVEDMFKKSSVIVTRLIEIDLQATEERRRLYESIMHGGVKQGMLTSGGAKLKRGGKLSSTDTFQLYKTFMGLADAEEDKRKGRMRVDRKVEDQQGAEVYAQQDIRRADVDTTLPEYDEQDYDTDVLDERLEAAIQARKARIPEPDSVSYMSVVSEQSDLLY